MHLMQQLLQRLPLRLRPTDGASAADPDEDEQFERMRSEPDEVKSEYYIDVAAPDPAVRFASDRVARKRLAVLRVVKGAAITLAALATLSGIAWLAVNVVNSLTDLKLELATAKRDLAITRERVTRIERRLEETGPSRPTEPDAKWSPRDGPPPVPLQLSGQAVQLLRDYIKMPPAPPGAKPAFSLGAPAPAAILLPVPQQIADKAPELEGARFTTDKDGSIILVSKGSRKVDAIVPPN